MKWCLITAFSFFAIVASAAPFALPIAARVTESAAEGKGWKSSGEIAVSYKLARTQFAVKIAAAGWKHLHTITLGKDRVVEAWSRGGEELTLMIWAAGPGKSGFSYGVSKKAGAGGG